MTVLSSNPRHAPTTSSHAPTASSRAQPRHTRSQLLGTLGEHMAARYLEMRGYRVLARNWRHRFGELDLIVLHGDAVVAVEVKTRSSTQFGHPLEAITSQKMGRLKALLAIWVSEQSRPFASIRVDAIGIVIGRPGSIEFDHRCGVA